MCSGEAGTNLEQPQWPESSQLLSHPVWLSFPQESNLSLPDRYNHKLNVLVFRWKYLTLQDHTGAFLNDLIKIFLSFYLKTKWFVGLIISWVNMTPNVKISIWSCSAGHHEIFCSSSVRLTSGNCSTFAHLQPLVRSPAFTGSLCCCCRQSSLWKWTLRYVCPSQRHVWVGCGPLVESLRFGWIPWSVVRWLIRIVMVLEEMVVNLSCFSVDYNPLWSFCVMWHCTVFPAQVSEQAINVGGYDLMLFVHIWFACRFKATVFEFWGNFYRSDMSHDVTISGLQLRIVLKNKSSAVSLTRHSPKRLDFYNKLMLL